MGFFKQLKAMLKVEYILMKRNLFLSFIEIFSPIILLFFFLFIRLLFSIDKEEFQSLYKDDIEYIFTHSTNLTNNITPDYKLEDIQKDESSTLPYLYFLKQCQKIKHIAIIGNNFPEEIKQKIISHLWEFEDPYINENAIFKQFENVDEFNKYISDANYGKDNNPEMCFGISKTGEFRFGIHYKGSDLNKVNSNELEELIALESPHIPDMRDEKMEKIRIQENLKFFEQYKNSGYLMVLKIIYEYFLHKITGDMNGEIQFSLIGMKFDEILKDPFHRFLSLLGFFIIISYSIPMSINIYKQIHLIETEKKEYLKTMGITEIIFFATNFIKCFLINIIHSIFNSLIVFFILKQSQYIYLLLIFFFFGLVIFSMTYFFQSFLRVGRMGVIISLLIYCVMSFVYLPMDSPIVNSGLRYLICILFPPTNLLLGLNAFYAFEKEFSPLDNRINLDVAELSISLMIVFLIINFIIYIFLGFVITHTCFGGNRLKEYNISNSLNNANYSGESDTNSFNGDDRTEIISQREKTKGSTESSSNRSKKKYKIKKSGKISNPPPKDELIHLGEHYIDSDYINDENLAKMQYKDYIDSKAKDQAQKILDKKLENLRKSLWKIKKNKIDIRNNNKDNPHFVNIDEVDEIEFDLENQIEAQKIRNLRKTVLGTAYNQIEEEQEKEKYKEDDLNISNIEFSLDESVKSSTEKVVGLITINDKVSNSNDIGANNDFSLKIENEKNKQENIIIEDSKQEKKIEKKRGKKDEKVKKEKKTEKNDTDYFKEEKEKCHVGSKIEVTDLTKRYKKKNNNDNDDLVLNHISFNLYENEIYALLGKNGEGKSTFVQILCGLKEATSGSIRYKIEDYEDLDVLSKNGNKTIRKIMGICTQNNDILYEDLTVTENLEFFFSLKSETDFYSDIREALEDYNLDKKAMTKVKKLSGGEKRRLMIAIACYKTNEIIILDEPTGGIDIPNKREIWEILKKQKQNRIILLITHYMDEAFQLADSIGILNKGKLDFEGDTERLKRKYGKYVRIQINEKINKKLRGLPAEIEKRFLLKNDNSKSEENNIINETGSKPNNLIDNSESTSSNSNLNLERVEFKEYKERASIIIPTKDLNSKKLDELLDLMENQYDIKNYYIDKANYDDIFINAVQGQKFNDKDKKKFLLFSEDHHYNNYDYDPFTKFRRELIIMMGKRFNETIRDKKSFILEILFPILLTLISCLLCFFEILEDNKSVELFLHNMDQNPQSIFYEASNESNFEEFRNVLSSEMKEEEKNLPNYWFQYIPNVLAEDNDSYLKTLLSYYNVIYEYSKREGIKNNTGGFYFKKADKMSHKYEFNFYISSKKKHSTIFLTNYLLRNIIRYEMKRSAEYKSYMNDIQITNSPFPLTYNEKEDKKSRNGFSLVFFISIALSLIPSNFITIILREKENKSKHLQILSGTSIYTYWINNYIFEIIKYYVVVGICLLILFLFNFYEKYLAVIYIFYGPALVSFTYVLSYFLTTEGTGQISVLLVNLFFGSLCGSAVLLLRTNKNLKYFGMFLSFLFRIVPSFCICYGFNQLISKKILFAIDYFKKDDEKNYEEMKKKYFDSSNIIKDPNYITSDIIFLALEMIIYTLLLIFLENKEYFLWKFGLKKINLNYSQSDEIETKTSIKDSKNMKKSQTKKVKSSKIKNNGKTSKEVISESQEDKEYPFEVKRLSKKYEEKLEGFNFLDCLFKCFRIRKQKKILDDISLKVSNGECYCLLGANGSGKTTSFKCFSKEIEPDQGAIEVGGINIKDFTKKQPGIGYCPQVDCIFEYLTVRENLMFYAKLKGVKEYSLDLIINTLLNKLDLKKDEGKIAHLLSGGNKRKLSVGISVLSRPVVILMDEPSTGMDPYSRQLLLDFLHRAYLKAAKKKNSGQQRSLILVTHLIQEAELLCDKLGILYDTKIKQNKKLSSLLQKESSDIILNIEFKKPSEKNLNSEFQNIHTKTVGNKEDINKLLDEIEREKYKDYLKKDQFGKEIYKLMKKRKSIKKDYILKMVKYLDYIFKISSKLKKYFKNIYCIHFSLNNFIFKITKEKNSDKCDSRIFGIIEGCKESCHIIDYNYILTSLETIFLKTINNKNDLGYSEFNKLNISL